MKKYRKMIGRIMKGIELPQDLDPHLFFVQWFGGEECLIEQHRGILRFESQRIRFATEQGAIEIAGELLEIERLSESRALVRGGIRSIALEAKS